MPPQCTGGGGGGLGSDISTSEIQDGAVTLAKMADLATDKLIGRVTAGTGVPEAVTCTDFAQSLLDDADAAAARTTLGISASGKVAQVVSSLSGAVATGTTTMPDDDTIPQNTEGTEFFTLAITPTNASSNLLITVPLTWSGSAQYPTGVALFVDTTAGALAAAQGLVPYNGLPCFSTVTFLIAASTTSARTYKIRIGPSSASTITINGYASGRKYGGVCQSGIIIAEILP